MNRYTELTPAAYNPMTMQEILYAPTLMRQKHNDLDQYLIDTENLINVDPLEVHSDEAVSLKNKYYNTISDQAEKLSKEGFNSDVFNSIRKTNKEVRDLIAPTGRIGQINNAKKVYYENMKSFLDDAIKQGYSRQDALTNWYSEMHNKYTGYDDPELKTNIVNIGQYGAPKRLVLQEDLKFVKSMLDETTRTIMKNNGFSWSYGPNGSIVVKDGKGSVVQTDNFDQLKKAQDYLNSRWNTQTGEGFISASFERISPERIINEINSGLGMMIKYKKEDTRDDDYSIQGYNSGNNNQNPIDPNIPSVTEPVVEFKNNRQGLIKSLSKIGTPKSSLQNKESVGQGSVLAGTKVHTPSNSKTYTEKDLSQQELNQYNIIYNGMIKSGLLSSKSPKFSKENITQIKKYLEATSTFSYSNSIILPDAVDNNLQKPLTLKPKEGFDMPTHLIREVSSGRRKLIDKNTQKEINISSYKNAKLEYVGMVSPSNILSKNDETIFNNDQFVIPHVVQIVYEDGGVTKRKEVYMDRDQNELKKPEFKASKVIKNTTFNGKIAPGLTTSYNGNELKEIGLKEINVEYDVNSEKYMVKYTNLKNQTFMHQNPITEEQFQNEIYEMFHQASKQ